MGCRGGGGDNEDLELGCDDEDLGFNWKEFGAWVDKVADGWCRSAKRWRGVGGASQWSSDNGLGGEWVSGATMKGGGRVHQMWKRVVVDS